MGTDWMSQSWLLDIPIPHVGAGPLAQDPDDGTERVQLWIMLSPSGTM